MKNGIYHFLLSEKLQQKQILKILYKKNIVADIPLDYLTNSKVFRRPFTLSTEIFNKKKYPKNSISKVVKKIFSDSSLSNREVIWNSMIT